MAAMKTWEHDDLLLHAPAMCAFTNRTHTLLLMIACPWAHHDHTDKVYNSTLAHWRLQRHWCGLRMRLYIGQTQPHLLGRPVCDPWSLCCPQLNVANTVSHDKDVYCLANLPPR